MDTFRVRLNCVDHYQATPSDEFDPPLPRASRERAGKHRPPISVIRVFGATETGQKVVVHVHGALQYTYIEYSGSLIQEDVDHAIRTLQLAIDHALAVSYRKNVYDLKNAFVGHISLVKGIPFYGYHVGYKFYLKIYLLNPSNMTRLADLLREGAVMKRMLQPYESHMQYIAQWMCDYNLYGCAYIDCEKVRFRKPLPEYLALTDIMHHWHDLSISAEQVSDLAKQSNCALEVDLCVQDILNRRAVENRYIHHDFIERIKPIPLDVKLVQSMAGLWKDETRRRKARMGLTDPRSTPFPADALITMSADPRNTEAGGWIHEEEYRTKVAELAADEYQKSDKRKLTFDAFVKPVALESDVKTALESVEDLYPGNLWHAAYGIGLATPNLKPHEEPPAGDEFDILERTQGLSTHNTSVSPGNSGVLSAGKSGISNGAQLFEDRSDQSDSNSTPPVSSSEFEKYSIRNAGDFSHMGEDAFEVPEAFTSRKSRSHHIKRRARFEEDSRVKDAKRPRVLRDADNLMPLVPSSDSEDGYFESGIPEGNPLHEAAKRAKILDNIYAINNAATARLSEDFLASNRDESRVKSSPRKSTLPFPVVKDPHDPNVILRLSQQSSQSQKLSQDLPQIMDDTNLSQTLPPLKTSPSPHDKTPASASTSLTSKPMTQSPLMLKHLPKPPPNSRTLIFQPLAPAAIDVESTMRSEGLPDVIYQEAYYSIEKDVPGRPREYAGREFKLESATLPYLPDFDSTGKSSATSGCRQPIILDRAKVERAERNQRRNCKIKTWSIADPPPSKLDVVKWLEIDSRSKAKTRINSMRSGHKTSLSQIDGPTQKNPYGFKYSQKHTDTSVQYETQYMTIMSLEVHVNTRGSLVPNPELDEVACIFWCVQDNDQDTDESEMQNGMQNGMHLGILALSDETGVAKRISRGLEVDVEEEPTELDVLMKIADIVRRYDPDILTGYEVHNSSWGYLIGRARLKYDLNLCDGFSRMKSQSHGRFGKEDDKWGFNHTSTIRVTGRHTINIWRAMRGELNLLQYTMENVVFHLLHRRIPHYAFADLSRWYKSKDSRDLAKVIEYYTSRVQLDLDILETNELVPRTSEQARLLGVDWFSVISRGSQFKVESLMFRIAKPENFILASPSRRQVGSQNALECLPLVMEPQSDFYTSPLLVLDFQSLYPSVMIAYNYCYSTFLGRVVPWRGTNKMGFTDYRREPGLIELLKDHINIAPNGIMYAKTEIRKSLLAKMLSEILETRVMVKSGMKVDKDDKTLQRLLNNRQLALKLIANVTYGYTSASFSGRMPCSEIADSIVQTARETLEKSIALIHSVERWGAEVVYGDTDSLFVYLKGRTRDQAFDIGEDIAATITKMNPRPVKLKFEKVYHPCVLLAKKRYVGFKYEHRNQAEPEFDAKGIETVRRDGTPAEQKIEETALKVLFRTSDLSQVKSFFQAQCAKIMKGNVSIQDFCFAKEVRLGTYSDKGPPPPGALVSARRMQEDPGLEPQYGERVPYVVITGAPGARLIDRCVAPEVLLNDDQLALDAEYYISKNLIPPLERIFNLVGANVRQWYDEMPKYHRIRRIGAATAQDGKTTGRPKRTLESYLKSSLCTICRTALVSDSPICQSCLDHAPRSLLHLRTILTKAERKTLQLEQACRSCSGLASNETIRCDSKDCPVFYSRTKHKSDLEGIMRQTLPVLMILEATDNSPFDW